MYLPRIWSAVGVLIWRLETALKVFDAKRAVLGTRMGDVRGRCAYISLTL